MFVFVMPKSHIHDTFFYIIIGAGYDAGVITFFLDNLKDSLVDSIAREEIVAVDSVLLPIAMCTALSLLTIRCGPRELNKQSTGSSRESDADTSGLVIEGY